MLNFHNKVAAITGAGSGIGRALALQLAKSKCHLALADINEEALKDTAELVKQYQVTVTETKLDVSNQADTEAWAKNTFQQFGRVNMIFNNAGVAHAGFIEAAEMENIKWVMDINFWGVVYGTKSFLPYLKASGEGHIINTSSAYGFIAQSGVAAYNASKFAVRGFTEALRQELNFEKCGVTASCVYPGGIKTNIANMTRVDDSISKLSGGNADQEELRKLFNDLILTITPEKAAKTILNGVRWNRSRILIGVDAYVLDFYQRLMPSAYQFLSVKILSFIGLWLPKLKNRANNKVNAVDN